MSEWMVDLAAWLLTFALHSTVLLGAVWCSCRVLRLARLEESLWKLATVGALLTTSIAGSGEVFFLSSLRIDLGAVEAAGIDPGEPIVVDPSIVAGTSIPTVSEVAMPLIELSALEWGVVLYLLAVLVLLLLRVVQAGRGWRALAMRHEVVDPDLLSRVARLRIAAGLRRPVRLSCNEGLASPVAFGLFTAEISVPPAVLSEMDADRRDCVLGHEIAHLLHRDAWWQLGLAILRCLLFFQPLLGVAHRRLRELAEFRCDAWVVSHTGDRITMANALVEVAGWLVAGERRASPPALAMAREDSALHQRVRRILDAEPALGSRWLRLALLPLLACLLAASYALPGVELAHPQLALTPVQRQLSAVESEIADLHEHLAAAWRRLEGRSQPELRASLQAFERHLQNVTQRHRALCDEAAAAALPSTTVETPELRSHSER